MARNTPSTRKRRNTRTVTMIQRPITEEASRDLDPIKAYLRFQPRRVRFFDDSLRLVWCNRPDAADSTSAYPPGLEHDGLPVEGLERDRWPVSLVVGGLPSSSRLYPTLNAEGAEDGGMIKVTAWALPTSDGMMAVEETERVASARQNEVALRKLDQDIEDLLQKVFSYLHSGLASGPMRLPNPYLQNCRADHVCTNKHCTAYAKTDAIRCWELTADQTKDAGGHVDILSKFHRCSQCEVFDIASPDSFMRISENFNRLISLLQVKYQETLDVQHRMQQADKLAIMGELLAGIAHEIKNPLGIIIGRLDIISLEMESMDPAVLSEDLATMQQQANRVRSIIDHMLAMARPEPPRFVHVQMNCVVMDSLEMVSKALSEKKILVTLNMEADLPTIEADQIQMQQVLLNLILNARDAMTHGGELRITTRSTDQEKGHGVEVLISDDGEGIPPEVQANLFCSFQTTKLSKGGTGLGLAVCRRIMEIHHGRISADSQPGNGTTMRLWFPVKGKSA